MSEGEWEYEPLLRLVREGRKHLCRSCRTIDQHQQAIRRAVDLMMAAGTTSRTVLAAVVARSVRTQDLTVAQSAHHAVAIGRAVTAAAENPALTAAWEDAPLGARRDLLTHTAEHAAKALSGPVAAVLTPVRHLIQLAGEELAHGQGVALGICPSDPPLGPTAVHAQQYLTRPRLPTRHALLTYAWLELAALAACMEWAHV